MYYIEEQEKKFGPIINALKNVKTTMKEVKDVAIKIEGDIKKLNIPYYYQPRNPELKRLISSEETIGTPKHFHQKSTTNSPLPKGVINLGNNATKYLPTTEPNNCFGIYYDKDFDDFDKIGKSYITFVYDDIILNGKKYKGTVGLWRLLTHTDTTKPEFYTDDNLKNYKQILIETDSIYQNNDKLTGRAKSSGGAKYVAMISKIWKEINENKKQKGVFISAEERAGNNNFHNEKLGILHLFKTIMENIIDTPEAITTATALARGVSAVYSAVTDTQHKKRIEQETIQHNKEMEKIKSQGAGLLKKKEKFEKMNNFEITTFKNNIKIFKGVYTLFWLKEKKYIKIEPLRNFDIIQFGNNIKTFRGCFMINELPIKSWVNECGVLNLNNSTQNGSHWVAWKKLTI
ncbi:hypothetical protein QTP88_002361 [Uroleucon formosanum]